MQYKLQTIKNMNKAYGTNINNKNFYTIRYYYDFNHYFKIFFNKLLKLNILYFKIKENVHIFFNLII